MKFSLIGVSFLLAICSWLFYSDAEIKNDNVSIPALSQSPVGNVQPKTISKKSELSAPTVSPDLAIDKVVSKVVTERSEDTVLIYDPENPAAKPTQLSKEEFEQQLELANSDLDMGYEELDKFEQRFYILGGQLEDDGEYYFGKNTVNQEDIEELEMLRDTMASVMRQIRFRETILSALTFRPEIN